MSSKSPNSEQKTAIETTAGLLLQAGAGSGKTYVIIEHITFKISHWIESFKRMQGSEDFSRYMKNHLSSTVLMTFTNMAAGEMAIRLEAKIKELMQIAGENQGYWQQIYRLSHMITITTIHGFCYKLIKQGFFKNINVDSKLISLDVLRLFIKDFLAQWLVQQIERGLYPRELIDRVLLQRSMFIDALMNIASDPNVMQLWDMEENLNQQGVWKDLCLFHSSVEAFVPETLDEKMSKTKWGEFMQEFHQNFTAPAETEEEFKKIFNFFSQLDFKIPAARFAKDVPLEIQTKYNNIKFLKDFLKKHADSFTVYWSNSKSWQDWDQIFTHIVKDMLFAYQKTNFMTYTDMEYLVWKGLKDREGQQRISKRYEYLIVDEFQDTSHMQFEIITSVVDYDFSRLYLVGDLKQAIYGFRGGEIAVFKRCIEQMPQSLVLKTNYRSGQKIIDFNNLFFKDLFKKTYLDKVQVEQEVKVEDQTFHDQSPVGKVSLLQVNLPALLPVEADYTLNSAAIDQLEAQVIRRHIQATTCARAGKVAILYRKLAPSKYLMDELSEHGIGFTTQVKIPLNEDPVLAIFKILMEGLLDSGGKHLAYSSLILSALLQQLGVVTVSEHTYQIGLFYNNVSYFGLKNAFVIFLQNLHLSIPNYENSLDIVDQIIEHNGGEVEAVYIALGELLQKKYSLQLKFGNDPDGITILTTHSSKGLQFNTVVVAGIYTNDSTRSNTDLIGKLPQSFQWTESEMSRVRFKSPFFIWENENNKIREFHESKRLFYVACTRAEQELVFVDFEFGEIKVTKSSVHSWANFLKQWSLGASFAPNIIAETNELLLRAPHLQQLPLFHSNNLGIVGKYGGDNHSAIIPELSATRLLSLAQCPKKFYFQNICKFEENHLDSLLIGMEDEQIQGPISGRDRGTKVHEIISQFIKSDFTNYGSGEEKLSACLPWIAALFKQDHANREYISEKLIKFSFFGHMITAIPDLFILEKASNKPKEIWDFKTGLQDKDKDRDYLTQLEIYLAALASIYDLPENYRMKLVICYVDEQKIVEQTISIKENKENLIQLWRKIQKPWVEQNEHCPACNYKSICQV